MLCVLAKTCYLRKTEIRVWCVASNKSKLWSYNSVVILKPGKSNIYKVKIQAGYRALFLHKNIFIVLGKYHRKQ